MKGLSRSEDYTVFVSDTIRAFTKTPVKALQNRETDITTYIAILNVCNTKCKCYKAKTVAIHTIKKR